MATDRHRETLQNGHDRGLTARWLLAGLGFIWLLRNAMRTKRRQIPCPGAIEVSDEHSATRPVTGHEQRDANAAWIFGLVAFLFVSGLCIHFILAGVLEWLKRSPPPTDRWRPSSQATPSIPRRGSFPILQISPPADLQTFRAREDAALNSYGWINPTAGIVHVPVERAMDLMLQQGLPVRAGTNQVGPSPDQLIRQRLEHR